MGRHSYNEKTGIVMLRKNIHQRTDRPWKPYFLLSAVVTRVKYLSQDDNACHHRLKAFSHFLENENVTRLQWPAMKPIEHVGSPHGYRITMYHESSCKSCRIDCLDQHGIPSHLQKSISSYIACTNELLPLFPLRMAPRAY